MRLWLGLLIVSACCSCVSTSTSSKVRALLPAGVTNIRVKNNTRVMQRLSPDCIESVLLGFDSASDYSAILGEIETGLSDENYLKLEPMNGQTYISSDGLVSINVADNHENGARNSSTPDYTIRMITYSKKQESYLYGAKPINSDDD